MTNVKPKANTRHTNSKSQGAQVKGPNANAADARDPNRSRRPSKLGVIRSLIVRTDGATLDELVSATGWQPHSVRAGMTALRKQGLVIVRTRIEGATRFEIETHPDKAVA
jgi:hypothetical protein